jgi:hypothetical protein
MRRLRGWRVLAAIVVTLWFAGWIPTAVWGPRIPDGKSGTPLAVVWIIGVPCALSILIVLGFGFLMLYDWAFEPKPRPSKDDLARRIADLERELNIR